MTDSEKALAKQTLKNLRPSWSELRYDEMHNKPYLIGKKKEEDETQVIHVMSAYKSLDFKDLKSIIKDSGQSSVTLAIETGDSSRVFYKCEMGLKPNVIEDDSNEVCDKSQEVIDVDEEVSEGSPEVIDLDSEDGESEEVINVDNEDSGESVEVSNVDIEVCEGNLKVSNVDSEIGEENVEVSNVDSEMGEENLEVSNVDNEKCDHQE